MTADAGGVGWHVRIYYEDTDVGGVVYHANYLKFMERARTEWLRELGYEQDVLIRDQDLVFAVQELSIRYLRPARFNDLLRVTANVLQVGRASIEMEQHVSRVGGQDQGTLLASGKVRLVTLSAGSFRPKPLPTSLRKDLQSAV